MVYELTEPSCAERLFAGWQETMISSCLQGVMGKIYVTEPGEPTAAFAWLGCFGFFAGEPDRELVAHQPGDFLILTPQNEQWAQMIEQVYPEARKTVRYAIRKDTRFDVGALLRNVSLLPAGYELRTIDAVLYHQCLADPMTRDFVSVFQDEETYLRDGKGVVILKGGRIVSGASSYETVTDAVLSAILKKLMANGIIFPACNFSTDKIPVSGKPTGWAFLCPILHVRDILKPPMKPPGKMKPLNETPCENETPK